MDFFFKLPPQKTPPFNEIEAEVMWLRLKDAAKQENQEIINLLSTIKNSSQQKDFLSWVLTCSPHLTSLMIHHIQLLPQLCNQTPEAIMSDILQQVRNVRFSTVADLKKFLRVMKGRAALTIAFADLSEIWTLAEVTKALSEFADAVVQAAVYFLLHNARIKGDFTPDNHDDIVSESGLIVLGMGKLGAFELNYSSDIDLIVFFDKERAKLSENVSPQKFFIKLTQELTAIIHDRTEDGYVFRVDLRLRPDPSSTPVALSTLGAITYYESVGQNWERCAMIKARQIAGDFIAGADFLKQMVPYVWRKNLDFAAIRDIHSIKRQIDAKMDSSINELAGFNVKLGIGGIREIEFYAQTQQLIWGGKQPVLRTKNTCDALCALTELGHICEAEKVQLTNNYKFLRILEHRLQMVADSQTHSIPLEAAEIERIACFMRYQNSNELKDELQKVTNSTHGIYAELFKEAPSLSSHGNLVFTGVENDKSTLTTLEGMGFKDPVFVANTIRAWHHGNRRSTRTKRARELITELVPDILKHLSLTPDPDIAFRKFDEFVGKLPAVTQVFALFTSNPELLSLIAEILGKSPYLADMLWRRPQMLEAILFPKFFERIPDEPEMMIEIMELIAITDGFEDKMNILRRYVSERQLQVGIHLFKQIITCERAERCLSNIADVAVKLCLKLVTTEFEAQYGAIDNAYLSVIAFGKHGGRELRFGADIDIVFVYTAPDETTPSSGDKSFLPNVYFMRLAQRVVTALSTVSSEGKLYEVDTRLRPHGLKGPIASSLESFSAYYAASAWPIEVLSLTRARVVTLNDDAYHRITLSIKNIVCSKLDMAKTRAHVLEVREKMAMQHETKNPLDVKYVRGGLIDAELTVQSAYLNVIQQNKIYTYTTSTSGQAEVASLLEVSEAAKFYRDFQMYLMLFSNGEMNEEITEIISKLLGSENINSLKNRLIDYQEKNRKSFEDEFNPE